MEISVHVYAVAALTLDRRLPIPTEQEGGWVPESVWVFFTEEKSVFPAGNRTTNPQFLIPGAHP
jgi:hypothetical protein